MVVVSGFAECPIPVDGTVVVRAPLGNILVDTSGVDLVEVDVSFPGIEVEESCLGNRVEISGRDPERVYENVDWNIRVPPSVALDLVTLAGDIRIRNTDGRLTARTEGGSVTVGTIGGAAAISTQGGPIVTGDIGGTAELRSLGGEIRIGRVGGNAELTTAGGSITAGPVEGSMRAETAGGSISVESVLGPLIALTQAGDITIGTAGNRVQTQTGGGNITATLVRGPFRGHTDFGDVTIDLAESSIDATSLTGDIRAVLRPASFEGDLHVMLEASAGSARLTIPGDMPASLEARVDRNSLREPRLRSDFRLESARRGNVPETLSPQFTVPPSIFIGEINGGGHAIHVRSSGGEVEIRRQPR
jgi:hypothetical protein